MLMVSRSVRKLSMAATVAMVVTIAVSSAGCAGARPGPPKDLPVPKLSTTVGPGDSFEVRIVGEKDLPHEYRVQPDGSIDFPYLNRVQVGGMEPQDIASLLKERLKTAKILSDAQLTIIVKAYASKKVSVVGQVSKPGTIAWTDGLRLVDAISQTGWFTPLADSNHVTLTRQTAPGKTYTVSVSVDAITDGQQADIPLQAGDTVKVDQRVF
jgi:polysaccharide biosynthesis/export protein VpsN